MIQNFFDDELLEILRGDLHRVYRVWVVYKQLQLRDVASNDLVICDVSQGIGGTQVANNFVGALSLREQLIRRLRFADHILWIRHGHEGPIAVFVELVTLTRA